MAIVPIYNRDKELIYFEPFEEAAIRTAEAFIASGKLGDLDGLTAKEISDRFIDKTPPEMLNDPDYIKQLPHYKTREAVVYTSDEKLIILQRGPGVSGGEAQSSGGGFGVAIEMPSGEFREETRVETLARTMSKKLRIDFKEFPAGEMIDLNIQTQGGDVSHGTTKDDAGVERPWATVEIGESYVYVSNATADEWLDLMTPSNASVGAMIVDAASVNSMIAGGYPFIDYRSNTLYDDIIFKDPAAYLSIQEIRQSVLKLAPEDVPTGNGRFDATAIVDEKSFEVEAPKDDVFTFRTLGVMVAAFEAAGETLRPASKKHLAAFRQSIASEPSGLDKLRQDELPTPGAIKPHQPIQ